MLCKRVCLCGFRKRRTQTKKLVLPPLWATSTIRHPQKLVTVLIHHSGQMLAVPTLDGFGARKFFYNMFPHHRTASTMLGCSIYDLMSCAPSKNLHLCLVSPQRSFMKSYGSSLSVCQLWEEPSVTDMNEWWVNVSRSPLLQVSPFVALTVVRWTPSLNFCGWQNDELLFEIVEPTFPLSDINWFLHSGLIWVRAECSW